MSDCTLTITLIYLTFIYKLIGVISVPLRCILISSCGMSYKLCVSVPLSMRGIYLLPWQLPPPIGLRLLVELWLTLGTHYIMSYNGQQWNIVRDYTKL